MLLLLLLALTRPSKIWISAISNSMVVRSDTDRVGSSWSCCLTFARMSSTSLLLIFMNLGPVVWCDHYRTTFPGRIFPPEQVCAGLSLLATCPGMPVRLNTTDGMTGDLSAPLPQCPGRGRNSRDLRKNPVKHFLRKSELNSYVYASRHLPLLVLLSGTARRECGLPDFKNCQPAGQRKSPQVTLHQIADDPP